MYIFAKYLTEYISRKNISYRKAALAIDMDRSQFRRYVIGDRLPKNEKIVRMIANGIGMSKEESELLLKYYNRSKMGEIKYNWYKTFKKLLNGNIVSYNGMTKLERGFTYGERRNQLSGVTLNENDIINIGSKTEIEELIKKICCNANHINIMFQTRIDEFYEMVFQVIKSDDKCDIEQIVQLNNINFEDDTSDIKIFENMYKMIQCGKEYQVFYTYNYFDINVNNNFIVSDNGIIIFNVFEDKISDIVGVYTTKNEIISYYNNKFRKMKAKCYVYGYHCQTLETGNCETGKMLENKESGMKAGVYKTADRQGMWILDNMLQRHRYTCIEENNIVNYFNMYVEEHDEKEHYKKELENTCE